MKWFGQHIWDFTSRFRHKVYLENITEPDSPKDHVISIDTDGQLYKQDVSSGDITAVTITTDSGGGSAASDTGGSADFSILGATGVGVTNSGTTITATAVPGEIDHDSLSNFVAAEHYNWSDDISGTATVHTNNITDLHGAGVNGARGQVLTDEGDGAITSQANLTFDGSNLSVISATEAEPVLTLKTTHTTANKSGELQFLKDAADTEDDEALGLITFYGEDEGNNNTRFAQIKGAIAESDEGAEGGKLLFAIATHDAELQNGLQLIDGNAEDEVDVTIASGTSSVTTVAGTLTMGSTATLDNSGNLLTNAATATNLVASTSTAVQLGSIELGHASDTTIARSASGTATIEGKEIVTRDKVIYIETSNFSDDIDTDAHYIPFVTTSEHTNFANVAVPFIAPAPGKLLGVHYKANNHTDTTSNTVTFRLDRLDDGVLWAGGNEATIGTKVVNGVTRTTWCSADFTDLTTAGASGTNAFDAGEMIGVSLQNSVNFTSTKYSVTLVFEFDFSSYYS